MTNTSFTSLSEFYQQQGYSDRKIMLPIDPDFYGILHGLLPSQIRDTGRAIVRADSGLLEVVSDEEVDDYLNSGEWDEVMGEEG